MMGFLNVHLGVLIGATRAGLEGDDGGVGIGRVVQGPG